MLVRGHFVCHVHCLVHDGAVRSSPCRPHHVNFGRNLYHMFVPAYSASHSFVFVLVCGIRVASMSSVDSIPFLTGVLILLCEYQSFLILKIVFVNPFQPVCFSSSGSEHFNIRKIQSQLPQRCRFLPSQVVFIFPPTNPFFLQGTRFLIQVSILLMEVSPFFFLHVFTRCFS